MSSLSAESCCCLTILGWGKSAIQGEDRTKAAADPDSSFSLTPVSVFLCAFLIGINTAGGTALKVACVSAAVSDESVAGDSGVYEASVQR